MSDFLQIDNFNVKQLDSDGKEVLDEFEQRFIELRKKHAALPDDFYKMATDFHIASCRAQTEVQKITMQHFAEEWRKDQKLGCELDAIQNWQTRKAIKKAFIREQRRLKKPLPWRYDFWGNLVRTIQSFIVMFIPPQLVRLFTRKPPRKPVITPQLPRSGQSTTTTEKTAKNPPVPTSAAVSADAEQNLVNVDAVTATADVAATADILPNATPAPTPASRSAAGLVSRRSVNFKEVNNG